MTLTPEQREYLRSPPLSNTALLVSAFRREFRLTPEQAGELLAAWSVEREAERVIERAKDNRRMT